MELIGSAVRRHCGILRRCCVHRGCCVCTGSPIRRATPTVQNAEQTTRDPASVLKRAQVGPSGAEGDLPGPGAPIREVATSIRGVAVPTLRVDGVSAKGPSMSVFLPSAKRRGEELLAGAERKNNRGSEIKPRRGRMWVCRGLRRSSHRAARFPVGAKAPRAMNVITVVVVSIARPSARSE
jgi:hypothetical protein